MGFRKQISLLKENSTNCERDLYMMYAWFSIQSIRGKQDYICFISINVGTVKWINMNEHSYVGLNMTVISVCSMKMVLMPKLWMECLLGVYKIWMDIFNRYLLLFYELNEWKLWIISSCSGFKNLKTVGR